MSKHTPGPWHIDPAAEYDAAEYDINAKDSDIASVWQDNKSDDQEAEANANLIAAAPELLEALKFAAERLECAGFMATAQRSAIAKAEGN